MKTYKYHVAIKTTKHENLVVWYDELYEPCAAEATMIFIASEGRGTKTYEHLYPKVHSLLDDGV